MMSVSIILIVYIRKITSRIPASLCWFSPLLCLQLRRQSPKIKLVSSNAYRWQCLVPGPSYHFFLSSVEGEQVSSAHLQHQTSSRKRAFRRIRKAVKCPTSVQKKIAFLFWKTKQEFSLSLITGILPNTLSILGKNNNEICISAEEIII